MMSKTFVLMATTRELARRLEGAGVDVIAGMLGCAVLGLAWVPRSVAVGG